MSFTRITLETHVTHTSTGVKFYWLASKKFYMLASIILHASQLRDIFKVNTVT
jgi:hypothetical protein